MIQVGLNGQRNRHEEKRNQSAACKRNWPIGGGGILEVDISFGSAVAQVKMTQLQRLMQPAFLRMQAKLFRADDSYLTPSL